MKINTGTASSQMNCLEVLVVERLEFLQHLLLHGAEVLDVLRNLSRRRVPGCLLVDAGDQTIFFQNY